ncbi:hypothetical protein TWF730_008013 [Orbilia blumenaviensis]|uniref:F-box domain-containing protein n=1 Tax=Orbilia blumenaviensis TaxID=1796055 RepID=A0AAV9VG23_9PEZI
MPADPSSRALLSTLPTEVLEEIFLYIPAVDLQTTCRRVCKSWCSIISTSTPVKYYSTTGLYMPTTTKNPPSYSETQLFTPFFLKIVESAWKELAPLCVKYPEPKDYSNDQERYIVSTALAKEIERVYHRYIRIFKVVRFINPQYRFMRSRVVTNNWDFVRRRSDILSDLDDGVALHTAGEGEGEREGGRREVEEAISCIKHSGPDSLSPREAGQLIFLCRFAFTRVPYIEGHRQVALKDIKSYLMMKVQCVPIGVEPGAENEEVIVRQTLAFMNFNNCKLDVINYESYRASVPDAVFYLL